MAAAILVVVVYRSLSSGVAPDTGNAVRAPQDAVADAESDRVETEVWSGLDVPAEDEELGPGDGGEDIDRLTDVSELNRALELAHGKRKRYLEVIDRAPETRRRIAGMDRPAAALEAFDQRLENAKATLRAVESRVERIELRLDEVAAAAP